MTYALRMGGPEFFGWGQDRYIAAGTYDAVNQNTRATGRWKGRPPKFSAWPRPKSKKKQPRTVKDLFARFNRK